MFYTSYITLVKFLPSAYKKTNDNKFLGEAGYCNDDEAQECGSPLF